MPATFGALCGLKVLLLGGNCLGNLPVSISRLAALQTLHVDSNCLASLPERLPQSLRVLHCAHNQLRRLPALPSSLHDLQLGHNQLAGPAAAAPAPTAPAGAALSVLLVLSSLTRLDVSANSLSDQDLLFAGAAGADGAGQRLVLSPLPALHRACAARPAGGAQPAVSAGTAGQPAGRADGAVESADAAVPGWQPRA